MDNLTTGDPLVPFYDEGWFYVLVALAITTVFQMLCFLVAATCKFDLLTDLAGSINFVMLAIISLCVRGFYDWRQVALTIIICAIRLELAVFLLVRVCVRKKDARFDETRENCCKFLVFWVFQIFWVWVCMLPVVYVNSSTDVVPLGAADYVAWAMMIFGFIFQMGADIPKYLFKKDPANKGKFCDVGLWSISRHPNYFGEFLIWWGAWVAVVPLFVLPSNSAWSATIVSPLFTMLILLGGSGIPTSEGKNLARYYNNPETRDAYDRYFKRTPPVIPGCPGCYEKMPKGCKCFFCWECPCYEYKGDEGEDSDNKTLRLAANDSTDDGDFPVAVATEPEVEDGGDQQYP